MRIDSSQDVEDHELKSFSGTGPADHEDEFSIEEYAAINTMLDQINSCLDDLEERNDSLNGKLHDLLESNRQARQEFKVQLSCAMPSGEEAPPDKDSADIIEEKSEEDQA
ncbi:hypothetical protein DPEC_G00337300 [Dallia pectoralis]|uniref:Uncharacterized protein n=1 Tax=Dallia pectoralis TaxID=75939 RepID=A0ACC2F7S9_DALPE|nr:hypothetical protein DPEC_G00337300 [Dallia pectoralis]